MHRWLRKAALPAVLVLGAGAAATGIDVIRDPVPALDAQATAADPAPAPNALSNAFRNAASQVRPAVVRVEVEAAPRAVRQGGNPFPGFPFGDFFGVPDAPRRPVMGSGSGFIISEDGYVLTNDHVVANANRVTVFLNDNRQFEAEVVGRDPNTDVAVLKIAADGLPVAQLGNSQAVEVGDWVLALGYPMSLGETVTAGIVSAKGRSIGIMQRDRENRPAALEHFIQTDAAINQGNSGGPLIDLNGRVIGINSAIMSPTGSYAGYGFAVPIDLAQRIAEDLIEHGAVHRPKLGVQIREVDTADAEVFGLETASGALVATTPENPARDAGVRMGDVIVGVDGERVRDTSELMARIATRKPGDVVTLDLIRYGNNERVRVTLDMFEPVAVEQGGTARAEADTEGRLGFAVREISADQARQAGFDGGGLVITQVDPAGTAPPVLRGMRIEQINGQQVRTIDDLRRVAGSLDSGATVSVIATEAGGETTIINYRLR